MKSKREKVIKTIVLVFCIILVIFGSLFCFLNIICPVKYYDLIEKYSKNYNLDSKLVIALINAESHFNIQAVSSKGAIGLMQIMPQTALFIAEKKGKNSFDIQSLFDVESNIDFGCYYLSYLFERFETKSEVICAYNAGEGVVNQWLSNSEYSTDGKRLNIVPYKETNDYLKKILIFEKIYSVLI